MIRFYNFFKSCIEQEVRTFFKKIYVKKKVTIP